MQKKISTSNNSEQKKKIDDEHMTQDSVDRVSNQRKSNEDFNDNGNKDIENKGKHLEDKYSENNQKNGQNMDKIKEDVNEEDKEEEKGKDINKKEAEGNFRTTDFDHENMIRYKDYNKVNDMDEQQEDNNQSYDSSLASAEEEIETREANKKYENKIVQEVKDNIIEEVPNESENETKEAIKKTSDKNEEMIAKDQIVQDINKESEEEFKETFKEFNLIEDMIKQMRRKLCLRPPRLKLLLNKIKEYCQFDKDCIEIIKQEKSNHESDVQSLSDVEEECN